MPAGFRGQNCGLNPAGGAIQKGDAGPACKTAVTEAKCTVKRDVFRCADEAAVTICVADTAEECVPDPRNRGPGFACEGSCTASEYAVTCINDIGVPATCREIFPDGPHPVWGGGAMYCCPCL